MIEPDSDAIHIPRRAMLRTSVGVLAAALIPEGIQAKKPESDFSFVVINDLHYRDQRCAGWFEKVSASIRSLKPRPAFVVLNGDLSESGSREQLGAIREIFRTLPMSVYTTIGNHDYTTEGTREHYEGLFGKRRNYRFDHGDWQFIALDSTDGPGVFRTWIRGETLGWLDANLPALSRDRPLVVVTHFPLGRNWLRPLNADDVNARLKGYNFQAALGGHWHGWSERRMKGVRLSTGRCCSWWRENHDGSELKGYFLARAGNAGIDYDFVAVGPNGTLSREHRSV